MQRESITASTYVLLNRTIILDKTNLKILFFSIPPKLIKEDLSQTKTVSHHKWVNSQFSSGDGLHKALKELFQNNLNGEKII